MQNSWFFPAKGFKEPCEIVFKKKLPLVLSEYTEILGISPVLNESSTVLICL